MKIAIYGSSGFGREVLPLFRSSRQAQGDHTGDIVFVDDNPAMQGQVLNGARIISFDQAVAEGRRFSLAIANSLVRQQLAEKCAAAGAKFASIFAMDAETYDDVEMAEGAIVCGRSLLTSNIRIGKHFHCNIFSYVAHDCVIGDYVTFGPRVNCNGNVVIEDHAYIGTGAFLKQGSPDKPLRIGRGAVIGMGAVVTADVPLGVTVVGNPARPLQPKEPSELWKVVPKLKTGKAGTAAPKGVDMPIALKDAKRIRTGSKARA